MVLIPLRSNPSFAEWKKYSKGTILNEDIIGAPASTVKDTVVAVQVKEAKLEIVEKALEDYKTQIIAPLSEQVKELVDTVNKTETLYAEKFKEMEKDYKKEIAKTKISSTTTGILIGALAAIALN